MKCRECGFEWSGQENECPACGAKVAVPAVSGEEIYRRAITAEREGKLATAMRSYAAAADLGVPLAAYCVCRCLDRRENPDLYEFWLMTASFNDPIAAAAYAAYLGRAGDEIASFRMWHRAAEMGSEEARMKLARYYIRHKNRPAARYYLNRVRGNFFATVLLFFLRKKPEYAPKTPEAPDTTVEMYTAGMYAERLGLPHIAFSYYRVAADAAYLPAVERVADMYMKGQGASQDIREVRKYLMQLGAAGKTDAYLRLADYYETGVFEGDPNPSAAVELYRLAAEAGDTRGMVLLGDRLADGSGVAENPEEALAWYAKAASNGSEEGKKRGEKLKRDAETAYRTATDLLASAPDKAVEQLTFAAKTGHAEALTALGDCYAEGIGTKKNISCAMDLYLRAAEQGNLRALYRMGCLYMQNDGVRFNARLARACLVNARNKGYTPAEEALAALDARRRKYTADKLYAVSCTLYHRGEHAEAARYRYAAAKLNHPRATYLLGCMCECGDGVERDDARAKQLYARALALGFDGRNNGFYGKYLRRLHG